MGQNASSQGNSKSFLFFKSTIPPQELEKMYLKRKEIMKEIVETEQRYVKSLEICFNVFYVPLKQKKLLKDVEIQLIFSSAIEFIFTFHQNFLGLLEDRMKEEWTKDTCIADIFVKNVRAFVY